MARNDALPLSGGRPLASAEGLQAILDGLPQMVWALETGGREYFNRKWLEFTGLDLASLEEAGRQGLIHPDDYSRVMDAWQKAQDAGYYEVEYRLRHHSGDYRWVVSRGSPQRDEDGQLICWYGTVADIHTRMVALEKLRASEALSRSIIEASTDPILLLDGEGRVLFMNEAVRRESTPEIADKALGRNWLESFAEPTEARRLALAAALHGEYARFDDNFIDPAGQESWWDISLTPINADGIRAARILVFARNVTEARADERRLTELKRQVETEYRRMRELFDQAPVFLFTASLPDLRIGYANRAAERMVGRKIEGRTMEDAFPEVMEQGFLELVEEAVRTRIPYVGEDMHVMLQSPDGPLHIFVDFIYQPIVNSRDEVTGILCVGSDVTERHQAAEEAQRLQAQVEHMSRLNAMNVMATTLAHELNQPLAAAANYLSGARRLIESGKETREQLASVLATTEQQVRRAGDIIRRVRGLIKHDSERLGPVEVPHLLDEALGVVRASGACADVAIEVDLPEAVDPVRADRVQVEQVLVNLIRNACDAMRGSKRTGVLVSARNVGSFVEFRVKDKGPGIRSGMEKHLFSSFGQSTTGGMGLGLSISRTIVEASGGHIRAENNPDGGASFIFTLPRAGFQAAMNSEAPADADT